MSEPTLDDIIAQLQSPDPDERANAAFILGRNRDQRIVKPLIAAITDNATNVRIRVIEALGTRDEAEVVPPIMAILRSDPDADVRRTAARSLGYIEDPRPIELLSNVLATDDDASVRAQAAEALGAIADPSATRALIAALQSETSPQVRSFVRQALVNIGGEAVTEGLIAKLNAEADVDLLLDLLETLGQLRAVQAADALEALTEHPDPDVAATARWALNSLKA